ncbi:polyprenyl synthetase family protein [Enterococcus saccharolyticus]|uniref:polyprenyl synthetase family protein n=1 Tax=Enterococcus saccharolyticus TaxID=41997 RepID=UPI001E2B09A7|nr:farnesyl diphosphate synthase [Enterococcus saccharolyticus]MCD5001801.1 polyprenyl synthetase family protein [Enterococcus saccharolyticus]
MSRLANLQQGVQQTEAEMVRFVCEYTDEEQLQKSMLYSIQAGGKRIRPLLLLATVASFSKEHTRGCYQTAAALEMIHTYSLIHDDLPAMDDDDLRRGKPTNHKVYGEALAILAGDGLLTAAFELLSISEIEPTEKILLIQLLAKAAGTHGMVAGQVADMQSEHQQVPLDELMAIHKRKTGALIRFAIVAGGILANQSEGTIAYLDQFAQHLGLAFQIRDDLLDVVGTTEELGKTANRDEQLEKSTYPGLLGLEDAKLALTNEIKAAETVLEQLAAVPTFDATLLKDVCTLFQL